MKNINKSVSLEFQIDDFGNTSLYKIKWDDGSYCITKLDDKRFQASYMDEYIYTYDTIEGALIDIEDHIPLNK